MFTHSTDIDKIAIAITKSQSSFKAAQKSGNNPFLKSKYSTLADLLEAVRPSLSENNLSIHQSSDLDGNLFITTTVVLHSSGQFFQFTTPMPIDIEKPMTAQAFGSLLTYSRRYGLMQALNIDVSDGDDDGHAASSKPAIAVSAAKSLKAKKSPAAAPEITDDFLG